MLGWIETGAFVATLGLPLVFAFALFGSFTGAAIALVLVSSITVSTMAAVRLASSESEADPDPVPPMTRFRRTRTTTGLVRSTITDRSDDVREFALAIADLAD